MRFVSPLLASVLIPLTAAAPLFPQAAGQVPSQPSSQIPTRLPAGATANLAANPSLELHVVDKEVTGARGLAIEVTDETGNRVPNATVVFHLPDTQPSGTFADGSTSAVAYTGADGRARLEGIRWSSQTGAATIKVTAVRGDAHAGLLVEENLSAVPAPSLAPPPPPAAKPASPETPPVPGSLSRLSEAGSSPGIVIEHPASPKRTRPPSPSASDEDEAAPMASPMAVRGGDLPDANVPIRHMFPGSARDDGESGAPRVSISSTTGDGGSGHHFKKKWLIVLAVAAGAGAGIAFAHIGSGSGSSSGVTVGTPVVSVGHP